MKNIDFFNCSHNYPLREAGAASCSDIVDLDITDGARAGDAGKAGN